jgi:uncharacterized membrane protein
MIPLIDPSHNRRSLRAETPWLKDGVRYTVAVLALVATCVAGYLTWTTLGKQAVVGCSDSSVVSCDEVLGSTWSKFLGMPTSAPGMLTYAAIFALSLAAGSRNETASRFVGTALVMLSLLAAGAALWFIGLQLFVVQKFCPYCMGVHACGLTIAGLVLWSAFGSRTGQLSASQSAVALAGSLPGAPRKTSGYANPFAGPMLSLASIGAVVGLVALVGGQVMFPPKTYDVSTVTLDDPISLSSNTNGSSAAQTHVVHRLPTDEAADGSPAGDDVALEDASDETAASHPTDDSNNGAAADEADAASDTVDDPPATKPAAVKDSPNAKREVTFLGGKLTVDMYSEAVIGSREAPYVVLELIDYTCPHCRQMHDNMKRAMRRYGDELAVVVMPVPLELECNRRLPKTDPMHRGSCRLARLAISVAQLRPSVFADFQNFLMRDEKNPPQYGTALIRGFSLVNRDKLRDVLNSKEIENRIQNYVNLYANLSARQKTKEKPFGLPVQIVGDKVLTGKFDTPEEMYDAWEEAIGIRPN